MLIKIGKSRKQVMRVQGQISGPWHLIPCVFFLGSRAASFPTVTCVAGHERVSSWLPTCHLRVGLWHVLPLRDLGALASAPSIPKAVVYAYSPSPQNI